jgi:hypothetical protein
MMSEFIEFKKIARLNRDIVITEKIDGTNAQILVEVALTEDRGGSRAGKEPAGDEVAVVQAFDPDDPTRGITYGVSSGSRNRWLQPGKQDNFGFAGWVKDNANELVTLLGAGRHFGEWWGAGVQRRYGQATKRFSLFNVHKYGEVKAVIGDVPVDSVPVLYRGPWFIEGSMHCSPLPCQTWAPVSALILLQATGSLASPGFMNPEGIVVFHEASGQLFKATIKDDEKPKGQQ